MSLKTDYGYNEDDFTQRAEQLHELTVTITLCEYRALIREQTRLDLTVERLQEEKAELEKRLKEVTEALAACKLPEWLKDIGDALSHWGEDQSDAEEGATQDDG